MAQREDLHAAPRSNVAGVPIEPPLREAGHYFIKEGDHTKGYCLDFVYPPVALREPGLILATYDGMTNEGLNEIVGQSKRNGTPSDLPSGFLGAKLSELFPDEVAAGLKVKLPFPTVAPTRPLTKEDCVDVAHLSTWLRSGISDSILQRALLNLSTFLPGISSDANLYLVTKKIELSSYKRLFRSTINIGRLAKDSYQFLKELNPDEIASMIWDKELVLTAKVLEDTFLTCLKKIAPEFQAHFETSLSDTLTARAGLVLSGAVRTGTSAVILFSVGDSRAGYLIQPSNTPQRLPVRSPSDHRLEMRAAHLQSSPTFGCASPCLLRVPANLLANSIVFAHTDGLSEGHEFTDYLGPDVIGAESLVREAELLALFCERIEGTDDKSLVAIHGSALR